MKETPVALANAVPGWLITLLLLPIATLMGFITGDSFTLLAAGCAGLLGLMAFRAIPVAAPVKLIFVVILMSFLQRLVGYVKAGEVRGANVGNLLLLMTFGYWIFYGLQRGRLYRPTPLDLWLLFVAIIFPCLSLAFTIAFRKIPGYDATEQLSWYKQWITPFLYYFLLCQMLETKRDVKYLFYLTLGIVALVVLLGMPEVLRFSNWKESRAEGILGQANDYAALLSTTVPFFLLMLFLYSAHRRALLLSLIILGCMGISLLTTYSRAGYISFAVALVATLIMAYKATGKITVLGPALLVTTVCLVPVVAVPQVWESLESRFATKTYKRGKRKSYSKFDSANQYSGGRLEIWKSALQMAEDYPIFGAGFHSFRYMLPSYHYQQWSNYCHNQFLGALAEGGIIFLLALLTLYWKLWRLLYHNWKVVFRQGDTTGIFICGGAFVSYLTMIVISSTNDFMNPGPKSTIFWIVMAGSIRYAMLAREEELPA